MNSFSLNIIRYLTTTPAHASVQMKKMVKKAAKLHKFGCQTHVHVAAVAQNQLVVLAVKCK